MWAGSRRQAHGITHQIFRHGHLAHETLERCADGGIGRAELDDRLAPELLADHRGGLGDRPFVSIELVDAGSEERLDGRRDSHVSVSVAVAGQHREHLLEEKGIAGRGCPDAATDFIGQRGVGGQGVDQSLGLFVAQRLESNQGQVITVTGPERAIVEELRAAKRDEQQRRVPGEFEDVFDEIEKGGFGPVDVVENDDERPVARERLEELSDRPEGFLGAAARLSRAG